jgi:PAS domain S-box-containing protein
MKLSDVPLDPLAWLAAIVESSDDAIVSKTTEGVITSWNASAERLYGYTAEEAVGKPITLIIPDDLLHEEAHILSQIARGERVEHFETERMTKDGRRVAVSLTVSPVRNAEGKVVGASKIARDITERRRIEQLQRKASRRKDEFLAMLGHELRNPLAPIRSATDVLSIKLANDPDCLRMCGIIDRQVTQLTRLIDDLLDVSRIMQGKIQLRLEPVDLRTVVARAIETVQPNVDQMQQRLDAAVPDEPVRVLGDEVRLVQTVFNILNNASKYTDRNGSIAVTLDRHEGQARIVVRDDGTGIEPELLEDIFDLFVQGERTLDRGAGGMGVGLALVRGIVRRHGGTVTARSEGRDRGAEFTVVLPLFGEAQQASSGEAASDAAGATRKRVVVVDDNDDAAQTLTWLLTVAGHMAEALPIDDPHTLTDRVLRREPDAVLLDVGLPEVSGYQVASMLRQRGYAGRIVAVTGYGQPEDRDRALNAGFDEHWVKPVSAAQVARSLPGPRAAAND